MAGADSRPKRFAWILVAAALVAYHGLLIESLRAFAESDPASLLFVPGEDTILVGLLVAFVLVWRRRALFVDGATAAARAQVGRPQTGWALAGLAGALFVLAWSGYVGRPDLQLISLAIATPAVGFFSSGRSGARTLWLPALVLLLSLPLPAPVESEWVWALQKITAQTTAGLLDLLGFDSTLEGIRIARNRLVFDVTESCSGLRPIQILVPLAIAIGDKAGLREGRLFAFGLFAAFVAFFLNAARLVLEAARLGSASAPSASSLGVQGLLLVGLALLVLFLTARALRANRELPSAEGDVDPTARVDSSGTRVSADSNPPNPFLDERSRSSALAVAGLAVCISVATAFATRVEHPLSLSSLAKPSLERSLGSWAARDLPPDYYFPYSTSKRHTLLRNYFPSEQIAGVAPGTVEVFVTFEARDAGGPDRIPRSKLPLPGPDWQIEYYTPPRTDLRRDRTVTVVESSREDESELALSYSWRIRDRGFLRESLRSLIGLTPEPDGIARPRAVVRLATSMAAGLRSDRRRATALLDRFVRDFQQELESL